MAELKVTIGADTTEFEQGVKDAGKTVQKEMSKKFEMTPANLLNAATGGLGSFATFISGAMFGPIGAAVSEFVQAALDGLKKLTEEAKRFRNLSIETGVSVGQLRQLQSVSDATGVGLDQIAHSMAEFNKKMGELQMRGGEGYAALTKLGYGLKDIRNKTFDYWTAIRQLSMAHKAGTDAATLAYYGNQLLGSSYESMLPIIKRSAGSIEAYAKKTFTNSTEANDALARLGDEWSLWWQNFKNIMFEGMGKAIEGIQEKFDTINYIITRSIAVGSTDKAAKYLFSAQSAGMSDISRLKQAAAVTFTMSEKDRNEFMKTFIDQMGMSGGKKLTPFGLAPAAAASQMQQMGGGDIFGAVAFSPLESIEKNTADAAQSLRTIVGKEQPKAPNPPDSPSAR